MGAVGLLPLLGTAGCASRPGGMGMGMVVEPGGVSGNVSRTGASNTHSINTALASTYRLVNRVTWGANDAALQRCLSLGNAAWLQEQLAPGGFSQAQTQAQAQARNQATLPAAAQEQIDGLSIQQLTLNERYAQVEALRKQGVEAATEELRKAGQDAYQRELSRQARETATRLMLRALYSPAQLQEKLAWFWFNHFNVHQFKAQLRVLLSDYEDRALRPHVLGSFRRMLGAVSIHPAMLQYLDNAQNAVGRLNENHARELLELHTLGVDGGYSQQDVIALARVLTGHGVNFSANSGANPPRLKPEWQPLHRRDGFYEFNPARHDFGDKQFLGRTIKGRGAEELDEVLDLLAAHPATARFVSRRLATFLLADEPAADLVAQMARAFDGGRIDAALQVLLKAPAFTAAEPGKFKDPLHFVLSAVRAAYGDKVVLNTAPLQGWLGTLGQGLYNRPTPDGYALQAQAWNSSGQLASRFDIARAIGSNSAGLFKGVDAMAGRETPAFPQLARPLYYEVQRPLLRVATRNALDNAATPQDWNALLLSSPDFMSR